jgi:hypothetical protein
MTVEVRDVTAAFNGQQKIELIKLYRSHTGQGIKDSKDAIESVIVYDHGVGNSLWDGKLNELLELFFGKGYSTEKEKDDADAMLKAFLVMRDSWKELGFKSFKSGVLTVIENF